MKVRRRKWHRPRQGTVASTNAWQAPPKRRQRGLEPLADIVESLRQHVEEARRRRREGPP